MNRETIAQERYADLCNYFDNDKDVIETLVNNREEFLKWLERMRWHVKKAEELFRENEAYQKAFKDIRADLERIAVSEFIKDENGDVHGIQYRAWAEVKDDVLSLIDKHNPDKSESEGEDADSN